MVYKVFKKKLYMHMVVPWKLKSVVAGSFLQTNIILIRVDCSGKLF